jgi:predicted RNase H-like HicB family nuclease
MAELIIEMVREVDGRWIAEVPTLPGVIVYGETREEAVAKARTLAANVIADRFYHGDEGADSTSSFG